MWRFVLNQHFVMMVVLQMLVSELIMIETYNVHHVVHISSVIQ